jgi:hypothetical protein
MYGDLCQGGELRGVQTFTIRSIPDPPAIQSGADPRAFEFVKTRRTKTPEWGEDYRDLGREAIAAILWGPDGDISSRPCATPRK